MERREASWSNVKLADCFSFEISFFFVFHSKWNDTTVTGGGRKNKHNLRKENEMTE